MATVRLEPLSEENRKELAALEIAPEQARFLDSPSMAEFIAQAPSYPTFRVHAVMDGSAVVGLISFGHEPDDHARWYIPLVASDESFGGDPLSGRPQINDRFWRASGFCYPPPDGDQPPLSD